MNKFTLVIMATLCTLLISCNKEELTTDPSSETQLTSRSVTNPIKVISTTFSGSSYTYFCTRAEMAYTNAQAEVDLTFADNTTVSYTAQSAALTTAEGYALDVTINGNTNVETEDLSVEVCGSELCYDNTEGTVIGTSLDFIVEDAATGL